MDFRCGSWGCMIYGMDGGWTSEVTIAARFFSLVIKVSRL